jgi:hypothetical protein
MLKVEVERLRNDKDRLDFILRFLSIDDIGDDVATFGIVVDHEALEDALSWGRRSGGKSPALVYGWNDDLRDVIDRARRGANIFGVRCEGNDGTVPDDEIHFRMNGETVATIKNVGRGEGE